MEWMTMPLKKYADFSGRARRKEYWMFYLLVVIAVVIASTIDKMLGTAFITLIVYLGLLIPLIAVGVRRMHDTDRSGWWLLVPIANFIFTLIEGTKGPNSYGDDPKGGTAA